MTAYVYNYEGVFSVQIDRAVFPDHDILDITAYYLSIDTDHGVYQDNGTVSIACFSEPPDVVDRYRLYVSINERLIFNGEITGARWNEDGTFTIIGQGPLAKLRHNWGGVDRVYNPGEMSTDFSVVQNLVEASGVDATLTDITGVGLAIGVSQDFVIHGGSLDPITLAKTSTDNMIDAVRLVDRSTVPNHVTYDDTRGVVCRRQLTIATTPSMTFSDSGGGDEICWNVTRTRDVNAIINKTLISGLTIAGVPLQAESSAPNTYLPFPWEYNNEEFHTELLDVLGDVQALADWIVEWKNGRLNEVSWTSRLLERDGNDVDFLATTQYVTSTKRNLSSQKVFVTKIRHHIDRSTAITTFTGEFRD